MSKCICGHPASKHDGGCYAKAVAGLGTCDCALYSPEKPEPMKARKTDPARRRFAAMRNKPFTEWVSRRPCLIANRDCWHPRELVEVGIVSDPAHVNDTRAQGVGDEGEVVNLCRCHHRQQEGRTAEFNKAFGVDLAAAARTLWVAYEKLHGAPVL